ncbi:MAG: RNA-binding protein [Candidatus Marinimicrobia bacterium]|nr:RNA-binding protein [Candidatus Neomarinimicrobiota bacterium]
MKKIYVGNLPFTATEEEVRELFSDYSSISSVNLITDRDTGRFRGFGFLELEDDDAAAAIKDLNDKDFGGRPLKVNEARERQERSRSRNW